MKNNSICITCTNGVYDFKHKWFDIVELSGGDYEELKEEFEMPSESYLLVTDCENNIGKQFLGCTNETIIDEISDKIGLINYIGITDEYMDLADELLQKLGFNDLGKLEFIAYNWDEYLDEIITTWELKPQAEMYINREELQRDVSIIENIIETSYGLYRLE